MCYRTNHLLSIGDLSAEAVTKCIRFSLKVYLLATGSEVPD